MKLLQSFFKNYSALKKKLVLDRIDKNKLKRQVCLPPTGMQGWKMRKKGCYMKECTIALLCNVTLFPKTLPYFYAIKFLKLNKIEKVFEIKSQIVQLKLNHKPTGA